MRLAHIGLCAAFILVSGCSGFGSAGGGGVQEGTWGYYPITDGFHHALPKPGGRIVVWGGHPSSTGTAINWLQRQGLRIVERAQLQKVFDEQSVRLTHTPDDEAHVLRVGKLVGADYVAFLDTPVTGGSRTTGGGFAYGGIGGSSMDSSSVYSTSAWIRGVSIETGEVLWSATARYEKSHAGLDDVLAELTCHALATAWGYRQPGKINVLPDMCMMKGAPAFPAGN